MLSKDAKTALIAEYGKTPTDTGSPEVQVALLTARINQISEHLKNFPKDYHSQRGLSKLVGQRRALLNYLKRKDLTSYENLTKLI